MTSLLNATIESRIIGVDVDNGALQLTFVLNGAGGPVALQLIDRTQKLQPRTIEFTHEQWSELLTKILTAFDPDGLAEGAC